MAEGVGELHLAIVVDCSPESLSEDVARGSFGRASTSTRLEALLDVARDYAVSSRASAATVLACAFHLPALSSSPSPPLV